jgi:hypothetical protein
VYRKLSDTTALQGQVVEGPVILEPTCLDDGEKKTGTTEPTNTYVQPEKVFDTGNGMIDFLLTNHIARHVVLQLAYALLSLYLLFKQWLDRSEVPREERN